MTWSAYESPGKRGPPGRARNIALRLADRAEEVCRFYLSNGRRSGNYWLTGNVENAPGRSLWVRIGGPRDLVGRWRDEAEAGSYGDLLDLVRMNGGHAAMADAMAEAERFLGVPPGRSDVNAASIKPVRNACFAARRLFARGQALGGTLGEAYLESRSLCLPPYGSVRFLANAFFLDDGGARRSGPALLAAIRGGEGVISGVHRTFIREENGRPVVSSRRILGRAKGNAVFLGGCGDAALVGEGLETVLSFAGVLEGVRLYAALSAAKLAAWRWPDDARFLLVAVDNDRNGAGENAAWRLMERAAAGSLPAAPLYPRIGDFN
ncbi:DUF7146 domain-containing protein, partial [Hyphococcus sp.]|uniref:DUF7146 domain-containing protein n=1 Tax=Hyphococcus sp. TaxID=2038636 RepID=UPI0035C68B1B